VPDTSIVTIELIVGAHCDNCPDGMAGPSLKLRPTSIYSAPQPDAWFAEVDGTFAGFFLHVDGGEDQRIPALGIVGYNSAKQAVAYKTMIDVVVPADDEQHWRVELVPIVPLTDDAPTRDGERVAVWRHPEQREPSCLMVEAASGGTVETGAIVPPTDPDCDHVLLRECAPNIPNAMNVQSTLADGNCMLVVPFSAAPVCMIGGPACTDGALPTSTACARLVEDHCLPTSLCECAPADAGCLFGKLTTGTSSGEVTAYRCTVPIDQTGALCPNVASAQFDGSLFLGPGTTCKSIRFLDRFLSDMFLTDSVSFDATVKLLLSSFRAPCTVDLGWEGAVLSPATMHTTVTAVDIELSNGRHLDIPVRVDTVMNCAESFTCNLVKASNESVLLCGASTP
jgi:hypothetical protein